MFDVKFELRSTNGIAKAIHMDRTLYIEVKCMRKRWFAQQWMRDCVECCLLIDKRYYYMYILLKNGAVISIMTRDLIVW